MREIKFRGKRIDSGELVTGDLIHGICYPKAGSYYILPCVKSLPVDCDPLDGYKCVPESISQYTGLKDKNGVEIYEGDIIEGDSGFKYDVRFGEWDGAIGFYVDTKSALGDYPIGSDNYNGINTAIKVIGNIYQNPELLNN